MLLELPDKIASELLTELQPGEALRVLAPLEDAQREQFLERLAENQSAH